MPKISIVKLSEVKKDNEVFRLDSEFFAHLQPLTAKKYIKPFAHFIKQLKNGDDFRVYLKQGKNYLKTGDFDIYGIKDIDKTDKVDPNLQSKTELKIGDLLITRKGNYGKSSVVCSNSISNSFISSEIFHLQLHKNINPYFLHTLLSSSFGQSQFEQHKHGVSNFSVTQEALKSFNIYIATEGFQSLIEKLVVKAHGLREEGKESYKQAEGELLQELGFRDFEPKSTLTFTKSFKEVMAEKRVDAEYFQPKYEEIIKKIKSYPHGSKPLGEIFTKNDISFEKKEDKKYNYIEIGDVNISNGEYNYSCIEGKDLPANAKILLKKNDLIISTVRTYRGAVAIIKDDNLIGSGAFCALSSQGIINIETLFIFCKTKFMCQYSNKFNVGTSYPVIRDDSILQYPIPLLPASIQNSIANKVQNSFTCQEQAKKLLEIAKTAVETAIEQTETQATEYIKTELTKINITL